MRKMIVDAYDDEVEDLLCLRYTMFSRKNGQAEVKMMGEEETLENKRLTKQVRTKMYHC